MSDSILKASKEAIKWAKLPSKASTMNNYRVLYIYVQESYATGMKVSALAEQLKLGAYWPCLTRFLIMDDPTLASYLNPHYIDSLDCQAGATWLCLKFREITSRAPKIRSWRHARQEVDS